MAGRHAPMLPPHVVSAALPSEIETLSVLPVAAVMPGVPLLTARPPAAFKFNVADVPDVPFIAMLPPVANVMLPFPPPAAPFALIVTLVPRPSAAEFVPASTVA